MTDTTPTATSTVADRAAGAGAPVGSQDPPDGSERRRGLGGADMAAILHYSPWRGPWQVYAEKLGYDSGRAFGDTPESRLGSALETVLGEHYAREEGFELVIGGFVQHPRSGIVHGHLDARVRDHGVALPSGILEIKTAADVGAYKLWGEPGGDDVPTHVLVQCQTYLAITGLPWCDVAALIQGRFAVYRIKAKPSLHDKLVGYAEHWWERHIVAGDPPPLDGSAIIGRVLRSMHGATTRGLTLDPDAEDDKLGAEIARLMGLEKRIKTPLKDLKDRMALSMQRRGCDALDGPHFRANLSPKAFRLTPRTPKEVPVP